MTQRIDQLYEHIGRRIKEKRKENKKTQQDLSHELGLSRASIANIESATQKISIHLLYRIAKVLNSEIDFFLPNVNTVYPYKKKSSELSNVHISGDKTKGSLLVKRIEESIIKDENEI